MRKLDNYQTFFVSGLGISAAVALAALTLTLDVMLALRAFIFIFAVAVAVATSLIIFVQDEVRVVEQNLQKNNVMREQLELITQAKALGLTHSRRLAHVQKDVENALSEEFSKLPEN